ncbi:MAG: septum formation initiator family protein [Deltaproteobacteria bacterium]|nr:septum formation initiator family protein [Deltaproteobacteria bacterium]
MGLNKKKIWKIPLIVFLFSLPLIVLLGYSGDRGLIRLYNAEIERQAYIEKIRSLIKENEELLQEVQRLRNDMKHIESVARKELNLIKQNEIIYRFSTDENQSNAIDNVKEKAEGRDKNKQQEERVAGDENDE